MSGVFKLAKPEKPEKRKAIDSLLDDTLADTGTPQLKSKTEKGDRRKALDVIFEEVLDDSAQIQLKTKATQSSLLLETTPAQLVQTQSPSSTSEFSEDEAEDVPLPILKQKKTRVHAYVPARELPAECSKYFKRGQSTLQWRLPFFFNKSTQFSTTTALNRFPWQQLIDEAMQSKSGESSEHIFDISQQITVSAEISFRFTSRAGPGVISKKVLDKMSEYLSQCERDALEDKNFAMHRA